LANGKERVRFYRYEDKKKWLEIGQIRCHRSMAKTPKINADAYRKKQIKSERQNHLAGTRKSSTPQDVKQSAYSKGQKTTAKLDQEIAQYLLRLNLRQKRAVLALVKAFVFGRKAP
jgi:hypothetical protein